MKLISITPPRPGRKINWQPVAFVALVILAVAGVWASAARGNRSGAATAGAFTQVAFEEKTGLRVTLVGVTAAGGLVDVRLKVLDPQKASAVLQEGRQLPVLIPDSSGLAITLPENNATSLELNKDGMLFFLFPNVRGAIQPGDRVTLEIGDIRLDGLVAK